jgi:hypothetical protein
VEDNVMSSTHIVPVHAPERPLSKYVLVIALGVGYAAILAALLYPIYMHLFVFD